MATNNIMIDYLKKYLISFGFIAFFIGLSFQVNAQNIPAWYLVSFTDKNNSTYQINNPQEFLSKEAIQRRIKNGIDIDSTDLPVNKIYIDSLLDKKIYVYHTSKWLNAVLIKIDTISQINEIKNISIVDSVAYMAPFIVSSKSVISYSSNKKFSLKNSNISNDFLEYKITKNRIKMVNIDPLLSSNSGDGVNIGVFDNGFLNVNTLEAFAHLYDKENIKYAYNFTNDNKDIYQSGSHGTAVLSTMAALVEGKFIGSAIGANYYLFQTEDNRYEFPIEEVNWLFAAEKADSFGVDIITSSLVYYVFDDATLDHNHSQLDGNTSIISRAASMASQKGIIVFNSAGNEGNGSWGKICFPSDAKDVITVGAVNKDEIIANFSSRGYTADKRIKPDICAEGEHTPVISSSGEISLVNGTSFSTPFAAGAMATLMQVFPNAKYSDLREAVIQSADQYSRPDSIKGYGIPDFYFASILLKQNIMIEQIHNDKFKVLPNPCHNDLFILFFNTDSINIDINIYDMSGKKVHQIIDYYCNKGNNLIRIDYVSNLLSGAYVVELITGEGNFTKKIIKE